MKNYKIVGVPITRNNAYFFTLFFCQMYSNSVTIIVVQIVFTEDTVIHD